MQRGWKRSRSWLAIALAAAACGHHDDPQADDTISTSRSDDAGSSTLSSGITDESGSSDDVDGCVDADGDGVGAPECGGQDCDDDDPLRSPETPDNADFPWALAGLDDNGAAGEQASIALDPGGNVHVVAATYDGLRYASNLSGGWITETVDPGSASSAALGIAKDGVLHAIYLGDGGLRHATTQSGSWTVEVIDPTAAGYGVPSAIVVDPDTHVHALYFVGAVLRYATDAGGTFVTEDVTDTTSSYWEFEPGLGFARAPDGTLHAAFGSAQQLLTHAVRGPEGWGFESVQGGDGTYTGGAGSLAIDDDGTLHLAFHLGIGGGDGNSEVRYASSEEGGDWVVTPLEMYGGERPALAVDADGASHVVFSRGGYATDADGSWALEEAAIGGDGASVAVDAERSIHVAWSASGQLVYARRVQPDGIDQNCDGVDGVDADGDGFASVASGGADCDDASALAYPDAEDPPGDGIDQNCDGLGGPR